MSALRERAPWKLDAPCTETPPTMWDEQPLVTDRHRAVCSSCPVADYCAADALETKADFDSVRAGVRCSRRTRAERERTEHQLAEVLAARGITVERAQ